MKPSDESIEKATTTACKLALSNGVGHAVTVSTGNPVLGKAVGLAINFTPDRVKKGAALGGFIGAGIASKVYILGTAGSMAFGLSIMAPLIAVGAAVGGAVMWIKGRDAKD